MSGFKHVDEQIKMLKWAWYGEPAHELMHKAADTMQALLDRNKLLEDVAEAADRVSFFNEERNVCSMAEMRQALAKLQEQNDD